MEDELQNNGKQSNTVGRTIRKQQFWLLENRNRSILQLFPFSSYQTATRIITQKAIPFHGAQLSDLSDELTLH